MKLDMPSETLRPSSSLTFSLIVSAIFLPSLKMRIVPVTSSQDSSMPIGAYWHD